MSELVEILQRNKVKALLAIPGSVLLVRCIIHWYHRYRLYKAISEQQEKCKEAFSTITEELKSVTLDEKEQQRIFELTSAELQQELQKGQITAVDVLQVYQSQALEVNKSLNAVVEPLLDAKTLASACDPNAPEKGILFGIPISVKENFFITGKASTAGMVQFLEKISSSDAVLIQVVKSQGGIPFVRTNIPQTMMTYESSNPIYGRTNNPFDVKRIPGGSSSGEGSLIGSGASIIGLGSDIGGSIRVPCHFCGCYGLKPTSERLSRKGSFSFSSGQTLIRGSLGPMARDMEGVVLAMKGLLCDLHFTLDSEVPPIKFRDEIYSSTKPLRIGFYVDDGFIPAVPAVQRAVILAKKALEALGHTVVEFTPPRTKYAIPDLYVGTVGGDRNEQFTTYLDNDVIDPTVIALMLPIQGPKWTTWLLSMLIQFAARDPNTGRMLRARNGKSSVYEWFRHGQKFQDYRYEFEEAWKTQNLDAVICPPFACTAVPHGDIFNVISAGCYSMLYNILNYPAGVVPVTRVTVDDVSNMANYPRSTATQKNIHKVMVGSEGLPVGVQCVALPFQEELVLRVMRDVRDGMQTLKS